MALSQTEGNQKRVLTEVKTREGKRAKTVNAIDNYRYVIDPLTNNRVVLGAGTSATVFKMQLIDGINNSDAKNTGNTASHLPRFIANKVFSKQKKGAKKAFRSEYKVFKMLSKSSPTTSNTIKILGKDESSQSYSLAMELCDCDLSTFARSQDKYCHIRDMNLLRTIASHILNALVAMEQLKIVHCDLKPSNIFVKRSDKSQGLNSLTFVVGDLGSCKLLKNGKKIKHSGAQGTLLYFSPERANFGDFDCKSDVWALGCILFELGVGTPPFGAYGTGSDRATLSNIQNKQFATENWHLKCADTQFVDFLQIIFITDPALRPSASDLLGHAFLKQPDTPKVATDDDVKTAGTTDIKLVPAKKIAIPTINKNDCKSPAMRALEASQALQALQGLQPLSVDSKGTQSSLDNLDGLELLQTQRSKFFKVPKIGLGGSGSVSGSARNSFPNRPHSARTYGTRRQSGFGQFGGPHGLLTPGTGHRSVRSVGSIRNIRSERIVKSTRFAGENASKSRFDWSDSNAFGARGTGFGGLKSLNGLSGLNGLNKSVSNGLNRKKDGPASRHRRTKSGSALVYQSKVDSINSILMQKNCQSDKIGDNPLGRVRVGDPDKRGVGALKEQDESDDVNEEVNDVMGYFRDDGFSVRTFF